MMTLQMLGTVGRLPARTRAALVATVVLAGLISFALAESTTRSPRVIRITAERYAYEPDRIVLKKGEPVVLELVSEDRLHGFHVKALGIRADVLPGIPVKVRVVPDKTGTFPFTCDVFCGSGHGDMSGVITVTE
jgi:cytochrome c oxidase subunit II